VLGPEDTANRRVPCGVAMSCYLIAQHDGMSRSLSAQNPHTFVAARPIRHVALLTENPDECFRIPEYGFCNFPNRRIDFETVGFPRICVVSARRIPGLVFRYDMVHSCLIACHCGFREFVSCLTRRCINEMATSIRRFVRCLA
jgi:hypothetical protein